MSEKSINNQVKPKRNDYSTLLTNTFIFALGSFGSKLISFFLVPLYTNILTTEEYGLADLVLTCANVIIPIASVVIQDAVLRFGLSKENNIGSVIKNAMIVLATGSLVILACLPLFNMYSAIASWKLYLVWISISSMCNTVTFTYAKAKEKNKLYALMSILHTLVLLVVNIIALVVLHTGVEGYLSANILANVIPTVLLFFTIGAHKDILGAPFDWPLMKEMLKFSAPLIANNLSWWVLNSSDRVMIEKYLTASDLGLYTAASKIPALLSIITTIFSQAWSVSAIKKYESDRDRNFYSTVFRYFSLTMFLGASVVLLILKVFMRVYVGRDFYSSWFFVPPLLIGAIYFSFGSFFGAIYGALKKNIAVTVTTIVAAIINISINFALIPSIGVMAASISTAISYMAVGVIRMLHSRKYYAFEIDFRMLVVNTVIVVAQSVLIILEAVNHYIISICSLGLLLIINRKHLAALFSWLKNAVMRKLKR